MTQVPHDPLKPGGPMSCQSAPGRCCPSVLPISAHQCCLSVLAICTISSVP
ncbi:unnamed protein product, partial [Staurois parvus]